MQYGRSKVVQGRQNWYDVYRRDIQSQWKTNRKSYLSYTVYDKYDFLLVFHCDCMSRFRDITTDLLVENLRFSQFYPPVSFNPLKRRDNYIATSNNTKLVHWPLMGGLLHLIQRGGDWAGPQPAQAPPRCTKCNSPPINGQCTNHRIAV